MRFSSGHSLTEYAAVSVIALALIGAIFLVGGSFKDVMGWLRQDMASQQTRTDQVIAQNEKAMQDQAQSIEKSANTGITIPSELMDANELGTLIETSGANGATEELLARLDTQIAELQSQGKATQSEINALLELSEQGHKIAAAEKLLEDAAAKARSPEEFRNMQLTFDGKTMSTEEFMASQLGWGMQNSKTGLAANPVDIANALNVDGANQQLSKFLYLYQDASTNGALRDASMKDSVTGLVSQIAYLSEVSQYGAYSILENNASPTNNKSLMVAQMQYMEPLVVKATGNPNAISQSTHGMSDAICTIGNQKKGKCP